MLADWLNEIQDGNGTSTNGDFLRALIENLYKAIVEFLNALGEWPIDLK